MYVTVSLMTASFDSVSPFVIEGKAARAEERALAREVVSRMSAAMIEEKGLLNHAQAALVLGVSVKRIGELVRLGKLTRFDFFDRTYVSMREVCQRDDEEFRERGPGRITRNRSGAVEARRLCGTSA
jgi:hypothetical protein